ncbi:MAG: ABC transporter [Chloroflexi bacterium]|nr:MAG: ABC transporter [Chloroflexota bacterium]
MSHNLAAIYTIWKREMLRWWRDKPRIIGSMTFPIIFLFVFGSGLSGSMGNLAGGASMQPPPGVEVDFKQFIFPGIVGMNLFFAAIFSGISVVFDREFGILKEVLVAPINRSAIAFGKTLGGATVATLQGTLVFIFAPVAGIEISLPLFLALWPMMFLTAFALTAMGVTIASRMRSTEGFQVINQFITFPMIFLSGAFFPLTNLPSWMEFIVKINPASYAVDLLRRVVLSFQDLPDFIMDNLSRFGLGMEFFGQPLTVWGDVLIVLTFGLIMVGIGMYLFSLRD